MSLMHKNLLAVFGRVCVLALLVGLFILGYEVGFEGTCHRCRHGRRTRQDKTMQSLQIEIAESQRLAALRKVDKIPFAQSICGWDDWDCWMKVICLKNTNLEDWKTLREDVVLAIAERAVPYTFETTHFSAVMYIVGVKDIWRVEVDTALEEKIWSIVNRHNGALDRCSAKEFWALLSAEATRKGQLTAETWQYIGGPYKVYEANGK